MQYSTKQLRNDHLPLISQTIQKMLDELICLFSCGLQHMDSPTLSDQQGLPTLEADEKSCSERSMIGIDEQRELRAARVTWWKLYIYIYIAPYPTPRCSSYWEGDLRIALEYCHQLYLLFIPDIGIMCSPMAWETWVQSQFESYQRLKKWYLMLPCLTLGIIR